MIRLTLIAAMFAATLVVAAMPSPSPGRLTGAERVCVNRCEAKGWPPACFERCMRTWR